MCIRDSLIVELKTKPEVGNDLSSENLVNSVQLEALTVPDLQDAQAIVLADMTGRLISLTRPNGTPLASSYVTDILNLEVGQLDPAQVMIKEDALALLDHLAKSPATPTTQHPTKSAKAPKTQNPNSTTFATTTPTPSDNKVFDFETDQGPDEPDSHPRIVR